MTFFLVYRTYPDRPDTYPVATFAFLTDAAAYLDLRLRDEPWLDDYMHIGIVREV